VRLLTRSDFDGSVCAALLEEIGLVDEIHFIHPKDLQDNKIEVSKNDIIANCPYVEGCGLWFDHHSSEQERLKLDGNFEGASEMAPSAAEVVFNYFMARDAYAPALGRFSELVRIAGIVDSAKFSGKDIIKPSGFIMLAFISDPRTGLGRKHRFRISNFDLMKQLPGLLRRHTVEEILSRPDFLERIEVYHEETEHFKQLLRRFAKPEGNALLIDLRGVTDLPVGNRFIEYVLFPSQNISMRIVDGYDKSFAMISVGYSIINRSATVNVGSLMLKYGGGGHHHVGACQIAHGDVDRVVDEILSVIH
jgi:hypothetical protein